MNLENSTQPQAMNGGSPGRTPDCQSRPCRLWLLGCGLALVVGVWLVREPLRQWITQSATLSNDAPTPDLVEDMIEHAADPRAALLAAWHSGKIVHREVAIRSLSRILPVGQALPVEFDSLLLAAAFDPDMNVRESALGILRERNHPALPALAAKMLVDADPQVRVLGLEQLKPVAPAIGVPLVMPLLEDSDPMIVALSLKLLENWSGEKFGVRLSDTAAFENAQTGLQEYPADSYGKVRAGAERAKAWWGRHRGEFPAESQVVPAAALAARSPVPAGDFQLRTLDGRSVRLSDFRGKVVLVNFWTTWCTACVSEMPELIALQKEHDGQLVILGVSLDFVPDEHGNIGGETAAGETPTGEVPRDGHAPTVAALNRVRSQIARTVKLRDINYPVLLDEKNEAGGRFNGGELPTTVIVDTHGNVCRRFVGTRSLPVFEAMIAEALQAQP